MFLRETIVSENHCWVNRREMCRAWIGVRCSLFVHACVLDSLVRLLRYLMLLMLVMVSCGGPGVMRSSASSLRLPKLLWAVPYMAPDDVMIRHQSHTLAKTIDVIDTLEVIPWSDIVWRYCIKLINSTFNTISNKNLLRSMDNKSFILHIRKHRLPPGIDLPLRNRDFIGFVRFVYSNLALTETTAIC